LYFRESDRPVRRRVAETREAAERIAAEVNAQLSASTSTMFAFAPMTIATLREEFLRYHEQVRRSSVATIRRYRTATQHLLDYVATLNGDIQAHQLNVAGFIGFLRAREVAPNGHPQSKKRRLRDKGVQFILETCRSLYAYAQRARHLPPYFGNPFADLQLDRMRIEDSKAIFLFDAESELQFLRAAGGMERCLHFVLAKTGMRSGELCHLLIEDLDLAGGWLHVRNKADLGWQIKTRNERSIPLIAEVVAVLRHVIEERTAGPVFLRLKFDTVTAALANRDRLQLAKAFDQRVSQAAAASSRDVSRQERLKIARTVWRDAGALNPNHVRDSFIKVAAHAGLNGATCPKSWRHSFATLLQDANVDPLIRQITLGHQPAGGKAALGMTSIYSHSRPETQAREIDRALRTWPKSLDFVSQQRQGR
jgi:integrase